METDSMITTTDTSSPYQKAMVAPRLPVHLRLAYSIAVWSFKAYFVVMLRTTRLFQRRSRNAIQAEVRIYPSRPDLKNRVFRPAGLEDEKLPVYLDVHGGGWAVADPETDDEFCSYLADRFGIMVVSIDYHKAPTYKFPCAMNDVAAMVDAVLNDETLHIDKSRVVLGGFSAGATLAFAATQLDILRGRINGLVGLYAALDLSESLTEKLRRRPTHGPSDILKSSAEFLDFAYVPTGTDRRDPLLSPIFAKPEDLPGNVYLVGAEYDMLCYESRQMAETLADAQVHRTERAAFAGLRPEEGWKQGGIRWECARDKQHAFTHIPKHGRAEKARVRFCQEMYSRVGTWLTEDVWGTPGVKLPDSLSA